VGGGSYVKGGGYFSCGVGKGVFECVVLRSRSLVGKGYRGGCSCMYSVEVEVVRGGRGGVSYVDRA